MSMDTSCLLLAFDPQGSPRQSKSHKSIFSYYRLPCLDKQLLLNYFSKGNDYCCRIGQGKLPSRHLLSGHQLYQEIYFHVVPQHYSIVFIIQSHFCDFPLILVSENVLDLCILWNYVCLPSAGQNCINLQTIVMIVSLDTNFYCGKKLKILSSVQRRSCSDIYIISVNKLQHYFLENNILEMID